MTRCRRRFARPIRASRRFALARAQGVPLGDIVCARARDVALRHRAAEASMSRCSRSTGRAHRSEPRHEARAAARRHRRRACGSRGVSAPRTSTVSRDSAACRTILQCEVRVGGYGGAQGLADVTSRAQGIGLMLDATHPYAAQISAQRCEASARANVPCWAIRRAAWQPQPGDDWRDGRRLERHRRANRAVSTPALDARPRTARASRRHPAIATLDDPLPRSASGQRARDDHRCARPVFGRRRAGVVHRTTDSTSSSARTAAAARPKRSSPWRVNAVCRW